MRRAALFGALMLIVAIAIPVAPASAAVPRPSKWSLQASPNRKQVSNHLSDVACADEAHCVAVGSFGFDGPGGPDPEGTLIETYAGTRWQTTASPGQGSASVLLGVACPAVDRCFAVGGKGTAGQSLIVTSSGGQWTTMPNPAVGDRSHLNEISCADATHCVAVGSSSTGPEDQAEPVTLVMTLSGGTWSQTPSPSPGVSSGLSSVSCRTATQCVAVGYRFGTSSLRTLALQLSGTVWTVMDTANRGNVGSELSGVTCTSATRCTAVGFSLVPGGDPRTLTESWSAGTWSLVASPNQGTHDNVLTAIDCSDATHCIAVGSVPAGAPLIEKLSGSTWTMMPAPSRGALPVLLGVDCATTSSCFAVGSSDLGGFNGSRTLVLRSR